MIFALLIVQFIQPLFASLEIEPLQCNALFNQTHGPLPCKNTLDLHNSTCGTGKPFAGNFNNDSICDLGCLVSRSSTVDPLKFEIYMGMANGSVSSPISFTESYGQNWPMNEHTPYALNVDGVGVDEIMLVRSAGSWSDGNNTVLIVDKNDDLDLFGVQAGRTILTLLDPPFCMACWCYPSGVIRFGDIDCDGRVDYHCLNDGVEQMLSGLDTSSNVAYSSPYSMTCGPPKIGGGYLVSQAGKYGFMALGTVHCNFGFEQSMKGPHGLPDTIMCENFKWTPVVESCGAIPICGNILVENGVVTYHKDPYNPDHYALVTCDAGSTLAGTARIVCDRTTLQWMSTTPTCALPCPMNGTIENGYFTLITSSQAKITCDQGFKYRGKPFEDISCDSNGPTGWPPLLCTEESFYHVFKTWQNKTVQNKVPFTMESQKDVSNCIEACKQSTMCRSTVYKETSSQCLMYDQFVSRDDMIKEDKSLVSVYSYH